MLREMGLRHNQSTADRLRREMAREDEMIEGCRISRLGHALRYATRARREGPAYQNDTPESFARPVHDVFARKAYAPDVVQPSAGIGLPR